MFEHMIKEVAMKELSNISIEITEKKMLLHAEFSSEKTDINGLFMKSDSLQEGIGLDGLVEKSLSKIEVKEAFSSESSYLRTMDERKSQALKGNGEWYREGMNLKFVPNSFEARKELSQLGLDGIKYDRFAEPDFSSVSKTTVQIDKMTSERRGPGNNFEQADKKCAEVWNKEGFEGKNDWTPREVEKWREDPNHHYTWHERSDMKTMDLVPSEIHNECKHYGGCVECKARDGLLGGNKYDN